MIDRDRLRCDIHDWSNCPVTDQCAACGAGSESGREFMTVTAETFLGVYCARLCDRCAETPWALALHRVPGGYDAGELCDAVMAHCEHLGMTVREMTELRSES